MAVAPWDSVPEGDQLFVLITGANSGVGLACCQRLIDEFLATRPRSSHLILIPTTRSAAKSSETVVALRRHLAGCRGPAAEERIHLLTVQVDLSDLTTVYAAARRLLSGTVDYYPPAAAAAAVPARITRLDAVVFNAGFGGWTRFSWRGMARMLLTDGMVQALTWPDYKLATRGLVVPDRPIVRPDGTTATASAPALAEVFCANVFGHYVLGHELMPLLCRGPGQVPRGRVIWTSSLEPRAADLRLDDLQGFESSSPYESSKRLTDVLALTANLAGAAPFAASYFRIRDPGLDRTLPVRPRMCLTHPGILATALFPVAWYLFSLYRIAMYLARLLGSPWHPLHGYEASHATVWAILRPEPSETAPEPDPGEDDDGQERGRLEGVKWGTSCRRFGGQPTIKKTEVDGWGWEGIPETADALAAERDRARRAGHGNLNLGKLVGRRNRTVLATKESRDEFEELGGRCWREMERLRGECDGVWGGTVE